MTALASMARLLMGTICHFAHRIDTAGLEARLETELDALDSKHKRGGAIWSAACPGDFYFCDLCYFGKSQGCQTRQVHVYGYSRHHPGKPVGDALRHARKCPRIQSLCHQVLHCQVTTYLPTQSTTLPRMLLPARSS